jgi:hypothetical protein
LSSPHVFNLVLHNIINFKLRAIVGALAGTLGSLLEVQRNMELRQDSLGGLVQDLSRQFS